MNAFATWRCSCSTSGLVLAFSREISSTAALAAAFTSFGRRSVGVVTVQALERQGAFRKGGVHADLDLPLSFWRGCGRARRSGALAASSPWIQPSDFHLIEQPMEGCW